MLHLTEKVSGRQMINMRSQDSRPDVPVLQLLSANRPVGRLEPAAEPQSLPDPVFPQHPDLLGADNFVEHDFRKERHWTSAQIYRTMRGWMFPWMKSRGLPGQFQPIIA